MACPIKNKEWSTLVKHFNGNETEAYRVFNSHGQKLPKIDTITDLKKIIKFQSVVYTEGKMAKIGLAINNYNRLHNTSHRFSKSVNTPSSIGLKLILNYMPKSFTEVLSNNKTKVMNKAGDVVVESMKDTDVIFQKSGNQYIVNGEVYPTYEDAERSMFNMEANKTENGSRFKSSREFASFIKNNSNKTKDLLKFLSENSNSEYVRLISKKLSKYNSGTTIKILSNTEFNNAYKEYIHKYANEHDGNMPADTVSGVFLPKTNTVLVKETSTEKTIIHEIVHALSYNILDSEDVVGRDFVKYFNEVKKTLINGGVDENTYGLKDEYEFIAELFSNPNFVQVLSTHKAINPTANTRTIWQELVKLLSKILGVGNDSIYAEALEKAIKVIDTQEHITQITYAPIMPLENKEATEHMDRLAKVLETTSKKLLSKQNIYSRDTNEDISRIANTLRDLRGEIGIKIQRAEYGSAILRFLHEISNHELSFMLNDIANFYEDMPTADFTPEYINRMDAAVKLYSDIIDDISVVLNSREYSELNQLLDEDITAFKKQIDQVKAFVQPLTRELAETLIREELGDESNVSATEMFDKINSDVNSFSVWFGSIGNSNDNVARAIYSLFINQHNSTIRAALNIGKDVVDAQLELEKSGHKDMSVFHEMYEGKKTGYLISQENWGEYYTEKQRMEAAIIAEMKQFGFDTFSDIPFYAELTAEQKAIFDKHRNPFRKLYMRQESEYGWIPQPRLNPEYKKLISNPALVKYRSSFLNIIEQSKALLPSRYSDSKSAKLLLPQIRMDLLETLKSKDEVLKKLGMRVKESFLETDQDTDYGDKEILRDESGNVVKLVPIHYASKIENTNDLSDDFSSMAVLFFEMAHKFNGISQQVEKVKVIKRAINGREFVDGNKQGAFNESNMYKMINNFMDVQAYGEKEQKIMFRIPGTDKIININKVADGILKHVRKVNLFMNISAASGFVKGSTDSTLDKIAEKYTSFESARWAEGEFDKSLGSIMSNIGKRQKTGKVNLLFEYNGIYGGINETFSRLNQDMKIARMTASDITYFNYTLGDVRIKGKFALSVYNNYRLVDNKFITKKQFERTYKDSGKKWSDYKDNTLYNAYEVSNNRLTVKPEYKKYVSERLENEVKFTIESRGAVMSGQVTTFDRSNIARGMIGKFLMLHRNWMVSGVTERFKGANLNPILKEMEEGYYVSTYKLVAGFLSESGNIKQRLAVWDTLDAYQKGNVMKTIADIAFSVSIVIISNLMQALADDEPDEYWIQMLAYLLNRIRLEQVALMGTSEAFSMLNKPTAAGGFIDTVSSSFKLVTNFEKIEYGAYEDMYQFQKAIIKNSRLKNIWEMRSVSALKQKNKYIISQIL